jgi:T-complex protein 1 subunit eta
VTWIGVDVLHESICNTFDSGVWEPAANKLNAIAAATEAACVILSIDETVRNPQSAKPGAPDAQGVGLQRGGPVSQGMGGQGMAGLVGKGKGVRAFKGRGGG